MQNSAGRRSFVKCLLGAPTLAVAASALPKASFAAPQKLPGNLPLKLKLSLNAYSFNEPLSKGNMNLDDLLEFCASAGFDAVDLTGYYFSGYPLVPADEYIYHIKKKAFRLGLDISGTGVRNDFSVSDPAKRKQDVQLVKDWIVVAEKLGAPVLRIFSGLKVPDGFTWQQAFDWMILDMMECAEFGKQHGVIVAMQNHNDFVKTADEAERIIKAVNNEWFGLVLDIGSYRGPDPYKEIAQTAKYAVNWQLKENMYVDGIEIKTDLQKIISLIKASGYRGYVPIETLGSGDPKVKVPAFLQEVRRAVNSEL